MKLLSFQLYLLITLINMSVFMNADITIDGNGNTLELSNNGELVVEAGKTLTLKDMTLTKLSGERLIMTNGTSKLKLDNARIVLDDAYSFSQGSIEVLNHSIIEGEFTFTFSGHNLFINKNSILKIGENTTFVCTPTGGIINPIYFEDETSSLFLNNATFKNHNLDNQGNYLGLIFTNGNFVVDGTSYLENAGTTTDQGVMLGVGPTSYGDCKLEIKPNAKLIIQNAALIYNNSGTKSLNMSGNSGGIETKNDGSFVLATNSISSAALNLLSSNDINVIGTNILNIYNKTLELETSTLSGQTGIGKISSLSLLDSKNYGLSIGDIKWSPDGGYIAVGGNSPTNGNELQVYQFDGASLTLLTNAQADYGTQIRSIEWSPDGKYIAIGGASPISDNRLQVYEFDGASLTLLTNAQAIYGLGGATVYSANWSPDNKYLAVGGSGPTNGNEVQIYEFNGSSLTLLSDAQIDAGISAQILSNHLSPDGKYLVIGGKTISNGNEVQVYEFDGFSLTLLTNAQIDYGDTVLSTHWSPDGKYLAVGGSGPTNGNEVQVYEFDGASLTLLINAQDTYGALSSIYKAYWSHDGKYLATAGINEADGNEVHIYEFNGSSLTLLTNAQVDYGAIASYVYGLNWSPNNKYLAIGGTNPANNNELQVYNIVYNTATSNLKLSNGSISLQKTVKLENTQLTAN